MTNEEKSQTTFNFLKIGDKAMKKIMNLAMMMVMTISANAMSYSAAKHEALFL